ncbi:MAG: acyl-CoA dehydrogenase family protein [Polyangiales bacterium]
MEAQAAAHDRDESFNLPLFRKLGEPGRWALPPPSSTAACSMDAVAVAIAHEERPRSTPASPSHLAHSLLFVNNLAINGSEAQRARYLPDACSGRQGRRHVHERARRGHRRARHGHPRGAAATPTCSTARRCGSPTARSLTASSATSFWSTPASRPPQQALDVPCREGAWRFSLGQKITDKLGMRASTTAELVFEDCEVPAENRVGEEGDATIHMMRNLEIERMASRRCRSASRQSRSRR